MLEKLSDLIRGRRAPHGAPLPPPPPPPQYGPHGHNPPGSGRSSFHQPQYPPSSLQSSPGAPRHHGADFSHGTSSYGLPPGYGLPGTTAATSGLPTGGSSALSTWYTGAPFSAVPSQALTYDAAAAAPTSTSLPVPSSLSAMGQLGQPQQQGFGGYPSAGLGLKGSSLSVPTPTAQAPAAAGPHPTSFVPLQLPSGEVRPPQSPPVTPTPLVVPRKVDGPSPRQRLSPARDAAASPAFHSPAHEFTKIVPTPGPTSPTQPPTPGLSFSPAVPRGQALSMDFHARRERGTRPYLEDTTAAKVFDSGLLLGVFDGHGGGKASDYCRTHLLENIATWLGTRPDNIPAAITAAFRQTDDQFIELARHYGWPDGSTAAVACIREGWLHVAHCGDTRMLLVREGTAGYSMLTEDHRPSQPREHERILQAGGQVQVRAGDTARVVPGFLAVSRSIGDVRAKPVVIADPEVQSLQMDRSWRALVLATDGLWDVVSPALCADICLRSVTAHQAADQLVTTAVAMQSTDNITALVVLIRPS
eukprot:GGOE01046063.1.p1 GENE.GGOE01046063.1~~GGOE01046063.1.p1  ORF type:complete len:531 (-),score=92.59 GGOE01046063.1:225-1817(-)